MNTRRLGLATAMVALSALTACSTWHGMTDGITGRSTSSDTARSTGSTGADSPGGTAMSADTMPGLDTSRMRGPTAPASAGRGMPSFRSYNACRTWLSQQGRTLARGPALGGEGSMADTDPCRDQPSS
jgi:hypothetical protein